MVFFFIKIELVKAAASGDSSKCEYLLSIPGANVSLLFFESRVFIGNFSFK